MRFWLKLLLGVVGGFAGGFAAGFLTHKKLNNIQFEEVSEEELEQLMQDAPTPKIENNKKDASNSHFKAPSSLEKALAGGETDPDKLKMAAAGKTPYMAADSEFKSKYSAMWGTVKKYSNEENANNLPVQTDDLDLEKSIDKEFMDAIDDDDELPTKPKPYQITLGQFYEERREYDKITIDWYDEDNVVLDEKEEIIPDPITYVGCEMKDLFKETPIDGDPDSIFMRNDSYGTDYEVIRHHGSYQRLVLGQVDE